MRLSVYSTAWNIEKHAFDYKDALDNWATFADEICIAVPEVAGDSSASLLLRHADERDYPVKIVHTRFDFVTDPFAYGQTENEALQWCTGDLLIQQNLDERLRVSPERLREIHELFTRRFDFDALMIPTIDLYGSRESYLAPVKAKWYIHRPGLSRGAARQGIKANGRPDYDKTSTDELLDCVGNVARSMALLHNPDLPALQAYVAAGWPISYHLGYVDLKDRLDRSVWWKEYWEKATGGDKNQHPTSIEELAAKATAPHGLPLWAGRCPAPADADASDSNSSIP